MVAFTYEIADPMGLHARPVARIAAASAAFSSSVSIGIHGSGGWVDGGDLLGLMALEARCGDELAVRVEGPDEARAVEAVREALEG